MKKILSLAVVGAAVVLASCDGGTKPTLNDAVDSLTYDLGIAQGEGLKQYMTAQLQVDSTCIEDFIKGMKDGCEKEMNPSEDAYRKGLDVGAQIKQMAESLSRDVYADDSTKSVNVKNLLAGLIASLKGTAPMSADSAYAEFNKMLEPIHNANLEKQYGDYKAENEKFLQDNKKKDGVVTLPSGLQYKVITAGNGPVPTDTTVVKCHYEGKLIDGTVFDSSYERGEPFEVNMAQPQVIEGWVEALKLMPAGSKWELYIPSELAYGTRDMGQIKPFSTLVFTVEIVK
ncbi:MAG: FKBP-type peptidyl-prolyl cis-trans isomerase [Prevotellaceae bacterium]|nr:FKBP-type peptidyl-prolyl cis-trans isomerase [Candidatus Colivivens equi]